MHAVGLAAVGAGVLPLALAAVLLVIFGGVVLFSLLAFVPLLAVLAEGPRRPGSAPRRTIGSLDESALAEFTARRHLSADR